MACKKTFAVLFLLLGSSAGRDLGELMDFNRFFMPLETPPSRARGEEAFGKLPPNQQETALMDVLTSLASLAFETQTEVRNSIRATYELSDGLRRQQDILDIEREDFLRHLRDAVQAELSGAAAFRAPIMLLAFALLFAAFWH